MTQPYAASRFTPEAHIRLFWKAPEMYELLEGILDVSIMSPNTLSPTCALVVDARRIKAAIDGEG